METFLLYRQKCAAGGAWGNHTHTHRKRERGRDRSCINNWQIVPEGKALLITGHWNQQSHDFLISD